MIKPAKGSSISLGSRPGKRLLERKADTRDAVETAARKAAGAAKALKREGVRGVRAGSVIFDEETMTTARGVSLVDHARMAALLKIVVTAAQWAPREDAKRAASLAWKMLIKEAIALGMEAEIMDAERSLLAGGGFPTLVDGVPLEDFPAVERAAGAGASVDEGGGHIEDDEDIVDP